MTPLHRNSLSGWELWQANEMEKMGDAIVHMERNGFALDSSYCIERAGEAGEHEAAQVEALNTWAGREVNWASPKQLSEVLHEEKGLPRSPVWKKGRTKPGEIKTDEAALHWIRNRAEPDNKAGINGLLNLRRIRGAIKYLTKLPSYVAPDGLIHAVSGPASDGDDRVGTITWRLASKNPEILQIPTDPKRDPYQIRRAFIAPEGHTLLCADETTLEAVILAHLFIRLFDDHLLSDLLRPGVDLHARNAKRVFGEFLHWERYGRRVDAFPDEAFKSDDYPQLKALRNDIKAIWYGLMYGKTAYGFATSLRDAEDNPIGEELAGRIVDALYAALPALPRYAVWVAEYVSEHHGIPGLSGAWCDLSALTKTGNKWDLARACRIAQNFPCQEGGARIITKAMVDILRDPRYMALGLRLERQVHDELDFRLPVSSNLGDAKQLIETHMTSYPLSSCLQVEFGTGENWAQC